MLLLYSGKGKVAETMPKTVKVAVNGPAKTIHLLSGVSGWGFPKGTGTEVVLIVRLHYADGKTEDHEYKNGEHFSDFIRRNDVPGSEFAFLLLKGRQLRYLALQPKRSEVIAEIESSLGNESGVLWLTDRKGRRVAIPVAKVAYVEVGAPTQERRVGFGAP